MVESSLKEVDYGVIEAAKAMGASNSRIIFKVLLVEARTSLITGATIAIGTILGYSAMAGAVGGGGLGDIAVRYGYYRYQTDIMLVTVALLIVIVQVFQSAVQINIQIQLKQLSCITSQEYLFQSWNEPVLSTLERTSCLCLRQLF